MNKLNILIASILSVTIPYNQAFAPTGTITKWRHDASSIRTTTSIQMSAVEKPVTAEEINLRLATQLEKLKAKDATSIEVKKEVSRFSLVSVIICCHT